MVEPNLQPYRQSIDVAETILEMSSGGGFPVYHFLFSFPRAGAAPRQVSECVTMMVTMAL